MAYKVTKGMIEEAERGLAWREEYERGGTEVGINRAKQIISGEDIPAEDVIEMWGWFRRHEVNKEADGFRPGEDGYPSNGRIAWALWGGDPGQGWTESNIDSAREEVEQTRGRGYARILMNKAKGIRTRIGTRSCCSGNMRF